MKKFTTCLWFDDRAEEAADFYTSIFPDSKKGEVTRYDEESAKVSGRPAGSALTVTFEINGQEFMGLNGGPIFKFSEAISFVVNCESQSEVDNFWDKLSDGGEEGQCGWLKDKFGVSWQIVPTALSEMLSDPDPKKSQRVMKAMLGMKKIKILELEEAYQEK